MILFDSVELTEFIELFHQTINHLSTFKKLRTAILVTSVLLLDSLIVLRAKVGDLVFNLIDVFLLLPKLSDLQSEVIKEYIKMSINDLLVEGRCNILLLLIVLCDRCHKMEPECFFLIFVVF